MVNQVTAYSAVVVTDPSPYIIFDPKGVIETCIGRDGDTYDHSLQLHYIGSILLLSFLLIYHPYPSSLLLVHPCWSA